VTNPEVAAEIALVCTEAAFEFSFVEWLREGNDWPRSMGSIEDVALSVQRMTTAWFHEGAILLDWLDASPEEGAIVCAFLRERDCTGLTREDVRAVVAGVLAKPG
jgi:hypothetical protein